MPPAPHYYRPQSVAEALALLQSSTLRAVPLAGGSSLVPQLRQDLPATIAGDVDAVVDLADLKLDYVELRSDDAGRQLCLGAMATLAGIAQDDACQELAGGLLGRAVRDDAPLNVRHAATIGGSIASGDPSSELLLALLALDAQAVIFDSQERVLPLADVLADPATAIGRGLIGEVRIPWPASALCGGLERVARTPADQAIVAAAAVSDGVSSRVAIGGIADRPVLLQLNKAEELEPSLAALLPTLDTPDDFRGSGEYRRAMALVVAKRALAGTM